MFILDENQQHHLLVILNEINRHIHDNTIQQLVNKKNVQKNQRKSFQSPSPITGFNFGNRQSLIEFILNTVQYFKIFFKYNSNAGQDYSQKSKNIIFWLSIFYNKLLFEHINFEQIFDADETTYQNEKNKEISAKSKVILNGAVSGANSSGNLLEKAVTNLKDPINPTQNATIHVDELVSRMNVLHELHLPTTSNQQSIYQQTLSNLNELNVGTTSTPSNFQLSQLSSFQQLNIPQLSNLEPKLSSAKDNSMELFSIEQQNSLNYHMIKDITFISLLITVIFYKLRYIFPNLVNFSRFETSWKFLMSFERELEVSFLHDSFLEFLQNELLQQRLTNKKRIESLKQEVLFLEKMTKLMDKEMETGIYRLVELQNKTNKLPPLFNAANRLSQPTSNMLSQTVALASSISNDTNKMTGNSSLKGARPCPHCGKVFRNTYKLNRHLYVHKDPSEKPFMCNWENCNYRSISKNDLNRHKMIHTGEKPYLCEIEGCEKRYSRADKLRHHKLSVHFKDSNKKEQICIWPGCNFQCLSKNELNRHQLTHEAIKCDFIGCDKIFDKVDKLKKHREKDHMKIEVTLTEFSTVANFSAVPISVTSTPDIATVVASSNHHHPHPHHHSTLQMQHVMLSNNQLNSIGMHHGLAVDDGGKMVTSDLPGHISLTQVSSESGPHLSVAGANNNVISTISSVPISVVASNNDNSNQQHRQNTISVWSS